MGLSAYSIMMKGTSQAQLFQFKKQVVQWTQAHGIKPAVKKWGLSRNTIRRWYRRFEQEGNKGLYDKRQGPKYIPHKTPLDVEEQVVSARQQAPCYGARRTAVFLWSKVLYRSNFSHLKRAWFNQKEEEKTPNKE